MELQPQQQQQSQQQELHLRKFLELLKSRADEQKFAGLLILSRLFANGTPNADLLKEIFDATLSDGFLLRMFWTGITELKKTNPSTEDTFLFVQIAVNMLSVFCNTSTTPSADEQKASDLLSSPSILSCQEPLISLLQLFFEKLSVKDPIFEVHIETLYDALRCLRILALLNDESLSHFNRQPEHVSSFLLALGSLLPIPKVKEHPDIGSTTLDLVQIFHSKGLISSTTPPATLSKLLLGLAMLFSESQTNHKFLALNTLAALATSQLLSNVQLPSTDEQRISELLSTGLIEVFSNRVGEKERAMAFTLLRFVLEIESVSRATSFKKLLEISLQRIRIELRVALEDTESPAQRPSSSKFEASYSRLVVVSSMESLEKILGILLQTDPDPTPSSTLGFEDLLKMRAIIVETMSAVVFFLNDALLSEEYDRNGLVLPALRLFSIWISEETTTFLDETEVLIPLIFDALRYHVSTTFANRWSLAAKTILPAFPIFTDTRESCLTLLSERSEVSLMLLELLKELAQDILSSPDTLHSPSVSYQLLQILHSLSNLLDATVPLEEDVGSGSSGSNPDPTQLFPATEDLKSFEELLKALTVTLHAFLLHTQPTWVGPQTGKAAAPQANEHEEKIASTLQDCLDLGSVLLEAALQKEHNKEA